MSKFQNLRGLDDKDRKWMLDGQKSKVDLKFVVFSNPTGPVVVQVAAAAKRRSNSGGSKRFPETYDFTLASPRSALNCARLASTYTYRYHPGPAICAERLSAICADKGLGPPVFKHLGLRVLERPPLHPRCYNRRGNGRVSRLAAEGSVCVQKVMNTSVCACGG